MENQDDQSKKIRELILLNKRRKTICDKITDRLDSPFPMDDDKKNKYKSIVNTSNKDASELLTPIFEIDIDNEDFEEIYNEVKNILTDEITALQRLYNEVFAINESAKLVLILKEILIKYKNKSKCLS